jgi:hypothetical protein
MIGHGTEDVMSANDWVGIVTIVVTIFALYASALAWLVGQSVSIRRWPPCWAMIERA